MGKIVRLNALILISFSAWGYWGSETPSYTALIPLVIGSLLMAFSAKETHRNKKIMVILLAIVCIGLLKPLIASFSRTDFFAPMRVIVMLFFSVASLYWGWQELKNTK